MNFCINCKHFRPSKLLPKDKALARCARKVEYDPVSGEETLPYCSTERMSSLPCGKEDTGSSTRSMFYRGRLFEAI